MPILIRIFAAALIGITMTSCQNGRTATGATFTEPAALPKPDDSGYAPVNGIKIYYEVFNARGGDPVVLLHGGCGSTRNWGNQVPALMKTHRVIALDSRGHGRSTRDEQAFTYHLMATDVLAVMNYLNVDRANVVGMSDGAEIGLDLAIHHSDRLSKLYLHGASYSHAGMKEFDPTTPKATAIIAWIGREYALLSSTPDRFDDVFKAINHLWETEPNFSPDELRRIAVPTHVAHSEQDEFVQTAHAEEMARLIPAATFELMRSSSHFVSFENPALFNRSLLAFLDGK